MSSSLFTRSLLWLFDSFEPEQPPLRRAIGYVIAVPSTLLFCLLVPFIKRPKQSGDL
jgi:hypothetical protein